MGEFLGSIHVRCEDRSAITPLLRDLAARTPTRFLVAPPRDGWVTIHPSMRGQDVKVSAAIAAAVPRPVLHLIVHDSDVFAYVLHVDGEQVDEYWSRPDYFDSVSARRREETAGRPEVLAAIVDVTLAPRIAALLDRSPTPWALEPTPRMKSLAMLLGIRDVEMNYESIIEGESRPKDLKQWARIPDSRDAERRRKAEVAAALRALRKSGRILLEPGPRASKLSLPVSNVLGCWHPQGGFLIGKAEASERAGPDLEWWREPWKEPTRVATTPRSSTSLIAMSADGRFLASGGRHDHPSSQNGWLDVHDVGDGRLVRSHVMSPGIEALGFTADGGAVACRSSGAVHVVPLDGEDSLSVTVGLGRSLASSPDGRWLFADNVLIDRTSMTIARRLRTPWKKSDEWLAAARAGRDSMGYRPQEIQERSVITPDGRWLVLQVEDGVRVYAWDAVLGADTDMPPVMAAADARLEVKDGIGYRHAHGLAVDMHRNRALFGSTSGEVTALDLESGEATNVLEIPGEPFIWELALGDEGRTLAVTASPRVGSEGSPGPPLLTLWSIA